MTLPNATDPIAIREHNTDHAEPSSERRPLQNHPLPPSAGPPRNNSNKSLRLPPFPIVMAVATESLTPSNHLPLEPTGLTPGFGGTPGFFSAEFGNLNPFDVAFREDGTNSPLRVEQPLGTPPTSYSSFPSDLNGPRAESALRRGYDPHLVPTPGPTRLPGLSAFKPSALKESITIQDPPPRLPPSPQRSPDALNPAFLEDAEYPAVPRDPQYILPPPAHPAYGSSRGVHGEVTPPTDESRSPDEKDQSSKSTRAQSRAKQSGSSKKRKSETEADIKAELDESSNDDEMNYQSSKNDSGSNNNQDTKRKKFLERNRLAASKCRQKKKEWANNLEEQARYQAQENKILRASVAQLRDECLYLKNFLLSAHSGCSCVGVKNYLLKEAQRSQQVAGIGGRLPIASLVHPGMDIGNRGYNIMGNYPMHDDRGRSMSVASGATMSDGRGQQGSMSPQ